MNIPTGYRLATEDDEYVDYIGDDTYIVPLLPMRLSDPYEGWYGDHLNIGPMDDEWENGYLVGSGENMYDDSYIAYLNNY